MRLGTAALIALFAGTTAPAAAQAACATIDPHSLDAEACAEAAFRAADARAQPFFAFRIRPHPNASPSEFIHQVVIDIQESSRHAQRLAQGYETVLRWNRPSWTAEALVAQGRIYEHLADAISDTSYLPDARMAPRVSAAMHPQLAPVRCLAVIRYLLATRVSLDDDPHASALVVARGRLLAVGTDAITECADDQHRRDATFARFSPAELARLTH